MMDWNNMMGGYGMFGGGLLSLLILGVLVVGIVVLIRNSSSGVGTKSGSAPQVHQQSRQTPIEILETRYAKGEIDKEEYEVRRKDLESNSITSR
jgi:putative membrane protein